MTYYELARELAEIKRRLHCLYEYKKLDLANCGESVLLGYLKRKGGRATPAELSEALDASTARVAALLNRMEKKGFVERGKHPDNNRNTLVRLLPDGEKENERLEAVFNSSVMAFFETLGEEEAELFVKMQRKMLEYTLKAEKGKSEK